ncbi:phage tail protein [Myxococcus sp. MxC21-1]|uniref:phage tail protein n=1 Tax=Myxococcus sp. MxC21-1 TaxID=3041439 RepID=UPI00292CFB66|nr:phage tail protein [Myxococcus sp. MxC21-1]WNZ59896.1 phage tail protein [Myxococcus sp. MxC21-1]
MERFPFKPSWGAQLESQPRVRKAQFGDGYSQRSEDGARGLLQRWSLQFTARRKEEADAVDAFLRAHRGVAAFEFVVPDSAWGVTGQAFGIGDGVRTQFLLQRPLAPDATVGELVPAVGWESPPLVYRAGVLLAAGADYALTPSGLATFTAAPPVGAQLTFTAAGAQVLRVVCERWTTTMKGFNAYDVSAEFQEEAG